MSVSAVSVVMPVYNAERYVVEAMESILAQTYRNFEFIIIDDGSTDDSLLILKRYAAKDSRIRLLSRPNTGIVGALNEGLSIARGKFVARMDADDLCRSDRLELQVSQMEKCPELVVLGSCANAIDPEGNELGEASVPETHEEIEAQHLRGISSIYHPAVIMRTEVLRKVGGYREGTCPCEDFDLWLRMGESGKLANRPEPLFIWRRTLSGIVATRAANTRAMVQRLLTETWQRRKLSGLPEVSDVAVVSGSDLLAQWGWQACAHGYLKTARKYAYKYLMAEPWRRNAWKLVAARYGGTKLRITFVLPYAGLAGGIRVAAIYAERLQRRGHKVVVVSVPHKEIPWRSKIKSVVSGGGWPKRREDEPSYFEGLEVDHRVLERWRPIASSDVPDGDVVIATWWETAEWVQRLTPQKGAKAYFIQHYEAFPGMPKERVDATWRMPMQKIVISQWLMDLAQERFGDKSVSHVPNSVDTKQFWASPREKQTSPTIGLLYSLVDWKGVDVSVAAVRLVQERLPNVKLLAFGAWRESPMLALPLGSEFSFQPPQDKIRDIYASCDVWLCSSRTEGFHLPPLEAMACRCPVVSTRVGGPADIIENGVNGYLVNVDDAQGLADRLEQVLTMTQEQWRKMSNSAYETANQYSWDDATDLFQQALSRAIERNSRGEFLRTIVNSTGAPA